jgi:ATP-dependent DNA helicase 2 subunit 2
VPRKFDERSELAFSSLVHGLYELESYAVARLVTKEGKEPQIVLLRPEPGPEAGYQCLYECTLPFAEDVRSYQFPPLDKVVTVTGNALTKHRLLPTEQLEQAMSDYVDAMDISELGGKNEEGYVESTAASLTTYPR